MEFTAGLDDLLLVSPLIILFLASLLPITVKVLRGNHEQHPVATLLQGTLGILTALVLLIIVSGSGAEAFSGALVFDGVTKWLGGIMLVMGGASLMLMYDSPATKGAQFSEITFLTLSSMIGMLILTAAADLLTVFIGLETMSLALYLMIAMSHEQRFSKEAAMKYFILGSFASAILLYGISFIFGSVGSTYISRIVQMTPELILSSRIFVFGASMVVIGFCFKVSLVPFHAWTPDVYQGAPTPLTAFMATAVKVVSFAAFLRLIEARLMVGSENLFDFLQWVAVITMVVGNVAAILQNNFKRMLAYSSIAHSGYVMVGIITTGVSETLSFGASGVIFYLFSYALMTLGAFACGSMIGPDEKSIIQIDDMAGYAKKRPGVAFCLTIFLFSLAGIPPLLGFFGKFYLFAAAIGEGLLWLALWGVLNSVISVYYYLRPIVVMYMKDGEEREISDMVKISTRMTIFVSAILVVILGVVSGPLFAAIETALSS